MQLSGSKATMRHGIATRRNNNCHSVVISRPAVRCSRSASMSGKPFRAPIRPAAQAESAVGEKTKRKRTILGDLRAATTRLLQLADDAPEKVSIVTPDDTKRCIRYATWAQAAYQHEVTEALGLLQQKGRYTRPVLPESLVILSGSSELSDRLFFRRTNTDTQALLGLQEDGKGDVELVVAFRGSESFSDWMTDFLIDMDPAKDLVPGVTDEDMQIHSGFMESANDFLTDKTTLVYGHRDATDADRAAFEKLEKGEPLTAVEKVLVQKMKTIKNVKELGQLLVKQSGRKLSRVVICGHSLGGALATLSYFWCRKFDWPNLPIHYYSYGAPRVGNKAFADEWNRLANAQKDSRTFRVVHRYDVVPAIPHADLPIPITSETPRYDRYVHVQGGVLLLQPGKDQMIGNQGNPRTWPKRSKDEVEGYQAQLRRRPFSLENRSADDHDMQKGYVEGLENALLNWSDKYEPLSG